MKAFRSVGGDSNDHRDECNDDNTAPSAQLGRIEDTLGSGGGIGFDGRLNWDSLMRKYMQWIDEKPMLSRCVVSATTAFLGALLARATETRNNSRNVIRSLKRHQRPPNEGIDMLEAISFAVHGGLVAGPLSYYVDNFLKKQQQKRKDSSSTPGISSSTYNLLVDQVAMAIPRLYLTFLVVDVTKTLLKRALPEASRKSVALLASALSDSLRFWPLSIYVL